MKYRQWCTKYKQRWILKRSEKSSQSSDTISDWIALYNSAEFSAGWCQHLRNCFSIACPVVYPPQYEILKCYYLRAGFPSPIHTLHLSLRLNKHLQVFSTLAFPSQGCTFSSTSFSIRICVCFLRVAGPKITHFWIMKLIQSQPSIRNSGC